MRSQKNIMHKKVTKKSKNRLQTRLVVNKETSPVICNSDFGLWSWDFFYELRQNFKKIN